MQRLFFVVLAAHMSLLTARLLAGDQPVTEDELAKLKREYADVLALQHLTQLVAHQVVHRLHLEPLGQPSADGGGLGEDRELGRAAVRLGRIVGEQEIGAERGAADAASASAKA